VLVSNTSNRAFFRINAARSFFADSNAPYKSAISQRLTAILDNVKKVAQKD